jgi:hypothetical protein
MFPGGICVDCRGSDKSLIDTPDIAHLIAADTGAVGMLDGSGGNRGRARLVSSPDHGDFQRFAGCQNRAVRLIAAISVSRTCRNRNCPKCQGLARAQWLEDRQAELLDVLYFHVVFTVPELIATIAFQNQTVVYDILFQAAAETLRTIAADPKHLGAEIGFLGVLHTWGQSLTHHPLISCSRLLMSVLAWRRGAEVPALGHIRWKPRR